MENLIQLQKGSKAFSSKRLFDEASFAVNEGEHVGVIGPNGAGKTTLFKVLIGEQELDEGILVKSRNLRLGYLSQHDDWIPGESIEAFVERDSVLPIWDLKRIGKSLGLTEEFYVKPIESVSGGYRMRAKLLRLIGQDPNLMLLDEPTNYLDLETLLVLEKFLQGFRGAFLVISHDREFLRRTTDHILEVEGGAITKYPGNIDDYFEQKEMLRSQLEARALSLEEKRKEIIDFVNRFGAKASKASQAQSRLKSLNKMESIEVKPLPVTARIRIPPPARMGKNVLTIEGADLGYPGKTVLKQVSLRVDAKDHLAVVGLNGAGKSTLLKTLAGRLPLIRGEMQMGYEATLSFFNQYVADELLADDTVFQSLSRKAHADVLPQTILDLAGSLLFSGDDVKKTVRVLSGGERARVALGQVLLQRSSCLVLDEPTNHLDFQTVEALTQALSSYPGALIVVSHDRGFIGRIGTKILEIRSGQAAVYPGTYDEYVWSVEKGAFTTLQGEAQESSTAGFSGGASSNSKSANTEYRERKKTLDRRLKQLETLIEKQDKLVAQAHTELARLNTILESGQGDSRETIRQMGVVQQKIDDGESEWMSAAEEREKVVEELKQMSGV